MRDSDTDTGKPRRPETDIEITPAMIQAGAAVVRLSGVGAEPCDGGEELAADVFSAMIRVANGEREVSR